MMSLLTIVVAVGVYAGMIVGVPKVFELIENKIKK